jgi:hypothetical protein
MGHVDAGHHFEQLARQMDRDPGRTHIDLAGTRLGIGDELRNRLTGSEGDTVITLGMRMMPATGVMLRMDVSDVALTAFGVLTMSRV